MALPRFILSLLSASSTIFASAKPSQTCRCTFGQSCWPSASEFSSLASRVSQPLLFPVPPEAACYEGFGSMTGNCSEVRASYMNGNWRSDQPGAMQSTNFETFVFPNGTISACYLNTTLGVPCGQGSVSVIGVDARSVSDVQAALKFAVKHNLRLVIKNTGHDYLGRSTARGAFMIWTHHMKRITYNKNFVPVGGPPSDAYHAITLEAGVQWHEAYDAVEAQGRVIVGGLSAGASVGAAGGWIQGGGHSGLSPSFGLGVDNALEFTVVTADGKHLTVNARKNADLFWALRGGGGGTYAIVMTVTYRTHPRTPLSAVFCNITIDPLSSVGFNVSTASLRTLTTAFAKMHPQLSKEKWGGYSIFTPFNLAFFYISPSVPLDVANATFEPLFALAQNLTTQGLNIGTNTTVPFPSFYSWYQTLFLNAEGQVGESTELGSRLLDQSLFEEEKIDQLMEVVFSLPYAMWNFVAGGAVSEVHPDAAGINPAWRSAIAHMVFGGGWPEGSPIQVIQTARNATLSSIDRLEALNPGSGVYFNEASLYEKTPKKTFFGSHYRRLAAIKKKYDADDVFLVAEGVGSDGWDKYLTCRV